MERLPTGISWREKERRYQCRFTFEKKSYYVYGHTIQECERKREAKLDTLKTYSHIDNYDLTLNKYYTIWIEEQKKSVKESSIYADEKRWKHLSDMLGNMKVMDISKNDIVNFQKRMSKNYSESTINNAIKLLSRILNAAMHDRIINYNPCLGVKKMKVSKEQARETNHRALTLDEQRLFFKYAKGKHYYNLFSFLINTGARIGEALALTWEDVDFDGSEISINKTVSRISNTEFVVSDTPKNRSSIRTIPITQDLKQILYDQKEQNTNLKIISFNNMIFPTATGKLSNYNNVNQAIDRTLKSAENDGVHIDHFSVHAFRDTFATRCIEQGMSPNTLKTLLGHSSLKMTMDLYAHILPNTKLKELSKVKFVI